MKDYYAIMEVSSDADPETIKKAFREKVSVMHPDKNKARDAKERFADLIEAYEIISKPKRRKAYDTIYKERNARLPVPVKPEVKEEFETYEKDAKASSKKYVDHSWAEFLALELFLDAGLEGLFSGGLDILDDAGDILGDIFDIF